MPLPARKEAKRDQIYLGRSRSSAAQNSFSRGHCLRASDGKSKPQESEDLRGSNAIDEKPSQISQRMKASDEKWGVDEALRALKWYKNTISPVLPKACRFLPTCSEYSMQAYQEFGFARGTILTAWRLARCNPLNFRVKFQGKYDPPQWPPVGFQWLSVQNGNDQE